jgi:NAD(P)-dependent dehydrogenase (short-subunit alcohol dehydrogenase family)
MSFDFNGKVVVVAGGTGALGRAVSSAFVSAGAHVVVTYRRQSEFDSLKTAVAAVVGYRMDLSDALAVERFVAEVCAKHGVPHALVNTVGGYAGGENTWVAPADTLSRMLSMNLVPAYTLARAVAPVMLKQGSGSIVNVAAKSAFDHPAGAASYAASKAAVVALFGSLAAELKGSGVRVNSIVPTIIDTPDNRAAMPNADSSKWTPAEEIARVILFLCSDASRAVHGAAIPV